MSSTPATTELYAEVLHFYGRQMQALDGGDFVTYADTFTVDGVFQHAPQVPPARTRPGIVAALEDFHRRFEGKPVRRRHWFNHVALEPQPDGSVRSTAYALILTVRPGERQPEVGPSCVVHDVLVRVDGGLLLKQRAVELDHEPASVPA